MVAVFVCRRYYFVISIFEAANKYIYTKFTGMENSFYGKKNQNPGLLMRKFGNKK